jgi:hypothetical protein
MNNLDSDKKKNKFISKFGRELFIFLKVISYSRKMEGGEKQNA